MLTRFPSDRIRQLGVLGACMLLVAAPGVGQEPEATPSSPAAAEDDAATPSTGQPTFERVRVVARPDRIDQVPASVSYLDEERLNRHDYSDVHRALSQVAGVLLQDEEGYGLRPNIGMRGTGVQRSSKITTMEDGVLIAPAPYAAPAAYYFPTVGRMEGIEVRKGSSAIRHGPFTTGGALNFLSSSIPEGFGGNLSLAAGDNDTVRGRVKIGDSSERFGWLFETYQFDTSGFKRLDGGGDTGVDLEDYLVKVRVTSAPGAAMFQALEVKAGKTEQFGPETYVGLTQQDFEADPLRRYAGSQEDRIDTDHEQLQARHLLRVNQRIDLTTTVYRNDFFRNWRKLEKVNGVGVANILADPDAFGAELAILRADLQVDSADDALSVRNNRRDYLSQGVQSIVGIRPGGSDSVHDIELGLRYHEDEEDRFQEEDGFRMSASGLMQQTSSGAPGSQANRVSSAEAVALFVQDTIEWGNWSVVPGLRFESIDFERIDYADAARNTVAGRRRNNVDQWIPGVGVGYAIDGKSSLFAGVHRGFSPPGPSDVATDPEQSVNYEIGYRRADGELRTSLVGFFNDYSNLLGACTVASGCADAAVGDVFDGGEVDVAGLEAELNYTLVRGDTRVPINVVYTFTQSEFQTSFDSDFGPWGDVVAGDELPYLPEHQASLGLGVVHGAWSVHSNTVVMDAMRTEAGQGPVPQDESTDSRVVVDLSLQYRATRELGLFVQVRNLTDETYVVARRPAGVRPGLDRTVLAGLRFDF